MKRAYNQTNKQTTPKNAVDVMSRIDECIYTARVAEIAVEPTLRRSYNMRQRKGSGRFQTVGPPIPLDVNVAKRAAVDWSAFHPDLEAHLTRTLHHAFRDVRVPQRYQLHVHKSMHVRLSEHVADRFTIRACVKQEYGNQFDYVSLHHDDEHELLDRYYVQVMLIFTLPSHTEDNDIWLMVKVMQTVKQHVAEHPKLKRLHLKNEEDGNLYSIFSTTTVLDKEHIIPDFDSNGMYFFVGKHMFIA